MSKAMLIMDMPECCGDCPILQLDCGANHLNYVCMGAKISNGGERMHPTIYYGELDERPDWCPLREVPKKMAEETRWFDIEYARGWNACIDEILRRD